MNREKISVIVPIYNVEKYLARCIRSIMAQTYQNLEIILVDDGTKDQSGNICEQFARTDSRIRVFHKENGGLSDARNFGLDKARGSYIMFIDSDDWVDADMAEILYTACQKYNADIAECSYRNIYSDAVMEETACSAQIIEGDAVFALGAMLDWKYFKPNAWNKLYKRQVIGDIRYPKGKIHEDEFTTYKFIYNARKLVYVDISKYNYDRTRTDSITGERFRPDNLDVGFAFRERVDFFREHHLDSLEEKMNNAYCWQILHLAYQCYQNHVSGPKTDALIDMVKRDIPYLEQHLVDPMYLSEFNILKDGIKRYGECRKARENG